MLDGWVADGLVGGLGGWLGWVGLISCGFEAETLLSGYMK